MTNPTEILQRTLHAAPVVPLIQSADPEQAQQVTAALVAGGLRVVEVVLRTPAAMRVVEALAANPGDAIVGVGTVLSAHQAEEAIAAGARFIVSPGLDEGVVAVARAHDLPVLPGIATATEAQRAWNLGLRHVKFFPASQAGGPGMLKALASVFKDMSFMPTGGIGPGNLADYLALKSVLACGGSWLTPAEAIAKGDFAVIETLCAEALEICRRARP